MFLVKFYFVYYKHLLLLSRVFRRGCELLPSLLSPVLHDLCSGGAPLPHSEAAGSLPVSVGPALGAPEATLGIRFHQQSAAPLWGPRTKASASTRKTSA